MSEQNMQKQINNLQINTQTQSKDEMQINTQVQTDIQVQANTQTQKKTSDTIAIDNVLEERMGEQTDIGFAIKHGMLEVKVKDEKKKKEQIKKSVTKKIDSSLKMSRKGSVDLQNSKRFKKDSPEMTAVKKSVESVENELKVQSETAKMSDYIKRLENLYENAILNCENYLKIKTTYLGNARYLLVQNKLKAYLKELSLISTYKHRVIKNLNSKLYSGKAIDGNQILFLCQFEKCSHEYAPAFNESKEKKSVSDQEGNNNNINTMSTEMLEKEKKEIAEAMKDTDSTAQFIVAALCDNLSEKTLPKKKGSDEAGIYANLAKILADFKTGEQVKYIQTSVFALPVDKMKRTFRKDGKNQVCDTLIGIKQDNEGALSVEIGFGQDKKIIKLPLKKEAVLERMQNEIISKNTIYGDIQVPAKKSFDKDAFGLDSSVILTSSKKILQQQLHINSHMFSNLPLKEVRFLAVKALRKEWNAKRVLAYIKTREFMKKTVTDTEVINGKEKIISKEVETNLSDEKINTQEILDLLEARRKETEFSKYVTFEPDEEVKKEKKQRVYYEKMKEELAKKNANNEAAGNNINDKKEEEWSEEEIKAKQLLSDLLFDPKTWNSDENGKPGERVKSVLLRHADTFVDLMSNQKPILSVINSIPEESVRKSLSDDITKLLNAFNVDLLVKTTSKKVGKLINDFSFSAITDFFTSNPRENKIKDFVDEINSGNLNDKFILMEENLDDQINECSKSIQNMFSSQLKKFFSSSSQNTHDENYINRLPLDEMYTELAKGKKGQLNFLTTVMGKYFEKMPMMDKRSMLSSALMSMKKSDPDNRYKSYGKISEAEAKMLGGLFKGAGPLLQKILQGVPDSDFNDSLKKDLADMKSNLSPIPQEIVEAQMLDIVKRSHGKITRINVIKSLGAASVGQAFKCRIYGPKFDEKGNKIEGEESREVVVKLLRSDARNRMMREKQLILDTAKDIGPSVSKTYEGQLQRIEEEFDLTLETDNVERGQLYNKGRSGDKAPDQVKAMKLVDSVPPTTTSMVCEMASGTTVDRYYNEIDEKELDIVDPYISYFISNNEVKEARENNHLAFKSADVFSKEEIDKIPEVVNQLEAELKQIEKRNGYLLKLSERWVAQGMFGAGFYHGDLHAGNIMISDNEATLIDFGNCTQLSDAEKTYITRMLTATALGNGEAFARSFFELIEGNGRTISDELKEKFTSSLKDHIFNKGSESDSGYRIAVALAKAQELDIELPASIYNFSQSQIRLQNTIDTLNKKYQNIQHDIKSLLEIYDSRKEKDNVKEKKSVKKMEKSEAVEHQENTENKEATLGEFKSNSVVVQLEAYSDKLDKKDRHIENTKKLLKQKFTLIFIKDNLESIIENLKGTNDIEKLYGKIAGLNKILNIDKYDAELNHKPDPDYKKGKKYTKLDDFKILCSDLGRIIKDYEEDYGSFDEIQQRKLLNEDDIDQDAVDLERERKQAVIDKKQEIIDSLSKIVKKEVDNAQYDDSITITKDKIMDTIQDKALTSEQLKNLILDYINKSGIKADLSEDIDLFIAEREQFFKDAADFAEKSKLNIAVVITGRVGKLLDIGLKLMGRINLEMISGLEDYTMESLNKKKNSDKIKKIEDDKKKKKDEAEKKAKDEQRKKYEKKLNNFYDVMGNVISDNKLPSIFRLETGMAFSVIGQKISSTFSGIFSKDSQNND